MNMLNKLITNGTTIKERIKNKKYLSLRNSLRKINEKQININDTIDKHSKAQNTRQKKWDEKAAKKAEKKKS